MKTLVIMIVLNVASLSSGQQAANKAKTPFTVQISSVRSTVQLGEPVELRIRLTNTSDRNVDASASYDGGLDMSYQYAVLDGDGKTFQPKAADQRPISGISKIRTLRPGETADETTTISDEYDFTIPGRYVVQISRAVSGDPKNGVVKSNKVAVSVVP